MLLEPGEANLPLQSVVVGSQVSAIEKARLGERLGSVSAARVDEILAGMRFLQVSYAGREGPDER